MYVHPVPSAPHLCWHVLIIFIDASTFNHVRTDSPFPLSCPSLPPTLYIIHKPKQTAESQMAHLKLTDITSAFQATFSTNPGGFVQFLTNSLRSEQAAFRGAQQAAQAQAQAQAQVRARAQTQQEMPWARFALWLHRQNLQKFGLDKTQQIVVLPDAVGLVWFGVSYRCCNQPVVKIDICVNEFITMTHVLKRCALDIVSVSVKNWKYKI